MFAESKYFADGAIFNIQNKEMPALKKASVGEITAGNKKTFVAAENGVSQRSEEKETLAEIDKVAEMPHKEKLLDPAESHQPQVVCF